MEWLGSVILSASGLTTQANEMTPSLNLKAKLYYAQGKNVIDSQILLCD
jgi:hypothetical protein